MATEQRLRNIGKMKAKAAKILLDESSKQDGRVDKAALLASGLKAVKAYEPAAFLLGLFSGTDLWDRFKVKAPLPPLLALLPLNASGEDKKAVEIGNAAVVDIYLGTCLDLLRQGMSDTPVAEVEAMARTAVSLAATQFTGKLINPSASKMNIFADPRVGTDLPHLSSRTLRQAGKDIHFDQAVLSPILRRLLRVFDRSSEDLVVEMASVPDDVEATLRAAMAVASSQPVGTVDHRLRQVLLPAGSDYGYIATSPLAAGGVASIVQQAAEAWNAQVKESEERESVAHSPRNGKEQVSTQASESSDIRPRKLRHMDMPVGGAKLQNVSRFSKRVLQSPLYFTAPYCDEQVRLIYSFIFRPWRPSLPGVMVMAALGQIDRLQRSRVLSRSDSLNAIKVMATGPLATLVHRCHFEARTVATKIFLATFRDGSKDVPITAELLSRKRAGGVVTDLDLSIINRSFDGVYQSSLATALVLGLRREAARSEESASLDSPIVRSLVGQAAQHVLEDIS